MNTLIKLNESRKQNTTRLLMFPSWFDKDEWKVSEYLQGGTLCKEKGLTIDWFNSVSFVAFEKCQIRKEWFIQCIAHVEETKTVKILTLIKKI